MFNSNFFYITLAIIVLATVFCGRKLVRGAYESAEYTVLESDGAFELREYPELMVAATDMRFESRGNDGSFMRLFRYISGANEQKQKVAMTTPVFMKPDDEEQHGQMAFVMPKKVAGEGVPKPREEGVQVRKRPGGRFAVFRFSGQMKRESFLEAEEKLRRWMSEKGLSGISDAEYAGYDPPATPAPLRRNEVLIRVDRGSEQLLGE